MTTTTPPTTPARTFELDCPDVVRALIICGTCTGDVVAVLEDEDDETVTLAATHDPDCPAWLRHRSGGGL